MIGRLVAGEREAGGRGYIDPPCMTGGAWQTQVLIGPSLMHKYSSRHVLLLRAVPGASRTKQEVWVRPRMA